MLLSEPPHALQPKYRQDWALENLLVLVAIPLLIAAYSQKDMALAMGGAVSAVVWLRIWRPQPRD